MHSSSPSKYLDLCAFLIPDYLEKEENKEITAKVMLLTETLNDFLEVCNCKKLITSSDGTRASWS